MSYLLAVTIVASLTSSLAVSTATAGPAERRGRLDKRLGAAEAIGAWAQGSRADRFEDRIDRREDVVDRREDRRDSGTGCVMGVEMDRQADLFLQCLDQDTRRSRFQAA